ncbi:MAG: hypothetical protein NTZ71_09930, partial [Planctomycetota bacterium]|nr:hypothetical protein [Planctomycetota bacterium]
MSHRIRFRSMANAFGKARSGGRRNTQAGELDITSYAYYDAPYARVQPGMREKDKQTTPRWHAPTIGTVEPRT